MTEVKQKSAKDRIYAGESLTERKTRRYQQFLEAGLQLMGTIGYRATTVRLLCKETNLTDRYFYESFSNTEDLLIAVYKHCMETMRSNILAAVQQKQNSASMDELICCALNVYFQAIEDSRVLRVCWLEMVAVSPTVDAVYAQNIDSFVQFLDMMAHNLYPEWQTLTEERKLLSVAAVGSLNQISIYWAFNHYKESRDVIVKTSMHVIKGVLISVTQEKAFQS